MRGRKPLSTAARKLGGNAGKRKLNAAEPQLPPPTDDFGTPPVELAGDKLAEDEWRRLAPMLMKARVITDGERSSLVAMCQQWSRYLESQRRVAATGMVVSTPSGYPIPNPYVGIGNKALQQVRGLWAELGLTPSARSRVVRAPGGDDEEKDPFAEFDRPARSVQ